MPFAPTKCPECGARLTPEEQQIKECWSCGWPDGDTPLAEISNMPPDFFPEQAITQGISEQE